MCVCVGGGGGEEGRLRMERPLMSSYSPALGPEGRKAGGVSEVVAGAACLRLIPLH